MESTRTLSQVESEIAQIQAELKDVHGTQTEVYARIVGYYRAVRNWNRGKADEFKHRKMFTLDASNRYDITDADKPCACSQNTQLQQIEKPEVASSTQPELLAENVVLNGQFASYDIFVRKTCPNCPPVKAYMANINLTSKMIDVDTAEGLSEAASKGVFAAPTVIVYDENGKELARGHNVEELTAIFEPAVVLA